MALLGHHTIQLIAAMYLLFPKILSKVLSIK